MRTVVIGAGRMGRRHIQVVKELGLELVGICDPSPESLAMAEKEQGVAPGLHFSDARQMLAETAPEVVVVASTAPTHCEYTCTAAQGGAKVVLCEKPMGVSLAECDLMIETCRAHGTKLAINHQMRFMEQYTAAKEIVDSDAFGGLGSVTVVAGNFGMSMNGTHYFEMFRYMTGETPLEVQAWFSPDPLSNPRGPQFSDRAGSLRLTTASGKRFYLEIGPDQGHGMHVTYAGPYGRLTVDELLGKMSWVVREQQYRELPTTRYGMPAIEAGREIAPADAVTPTRHVLQAVLNGEDWPSGEDGRQAVAVLVAAYQSDENGHVPVRVDENLNRTRIFPWA